MNPTFRRRESLIQGVETQRVVKEVEKRTKSFRRAFCANRFPSARPNIGAKVLSAILAKVLRLLTTTLTRRLCVAREHVVKTGEFRQKATMS